MEPQVYLFDRVQKNWTTRTELSSDPQSPIERRNLNINGVHWLVRNQVKDSLLCRNKICRFTDSFLFNCRLKQVCIQVFLNNQYQSVSQFRTIISQELENITAAEIAKTILSIIQIR